MVQLGGIGCVVSFMYVLEWFRSNFQEDRKGTMLLEGVFWLTHSG
jgi:hypothetical protein